MKTTTKTSAPLDMQVDWQELYDLCRDDPDRGFQMIVHHLGKRGMTYALGKLRRHCDAEDALQWTYIKVHRKLLQLNDPNRLPHWFMTILHRECFNIMRGRCRANRVVLGGEAANDWVYDHGDRLDDAVLADLERWCSELSDRESVVIDQRVGEGERVATIAAALETTSGNISAIRSRAIAKLRLAAQRDGYHVSVA